MLRKSMISLLVLALLALFVPSASAAPLVILDGKTMTFDVPPRIDNGRTLVPLRALFEALGAQIYWDNASRTVVAEKPSMNRIIRITIGQQEAYINDSPIQLDVPAKIVNERTLVPLRFVSEALLALVEWDGKTQTIMITSPVEAVQIIVNGELFGYYSGQYKNGEASGSGVFTSLEGVKYIGEFSNGIDIAFWEQGRLEWPDGTVYIGQLTHTVPEGVGLKMYPDGSNYKGTFSEGMMQGLGTMVFADQRTYTGAFTNDEATGTGTITWPEGNDTIYQGEVKNGVIEGRGQLRTANGDVYTGEFKNNWANGQGKMVFANGVQYIGGFVNGVMQGQGKMIYPNGKVVSGMWVNGVYTGSD